MKKRLVVLAVFALVALAGAQKPLPMQGSHQQEQTQTHPDKAQPDAPPPCISEVCKENAENTERYAYYKAHPKEYLKAAIAPANLSNWALAGLAVIGGALALFTVLTMRWGAERQLRAYIVPETGVLGNVADPLPTIGGWPVTNARLFRPETGPIAQIQIKNVGQTPAYDVSHWGGISVREFPLKSKLPTRGNSGGAESQIIMGAGVPSTKMLTLPHRLTEEEVNGLRNSTIAIFVYGDVLYTDIFKKRRFTRYRFMYHVAGGAIGVSTDLTFAEGGNEAD